MTKSSMRVDDWVYILDLKIGPTKKDTLVFLTHVLLP